MNNERIKAAVSDARECFSSGKTLDISARREALKRLYASIKRNEDKICEALYLDLGKDAHEAFMCEIGIALSEISYLLKSLNKLTRAKRVKTPLSQFPSRSYTLPTPYGTVLIMSPWNYPFLLTIEPLCDAIAAGNTAIVKPSAYAPRTADIIEKIINECFTSSEVIVIKGGREENGALLKEKFDMIFFTGSTNVGREVLRCAADNLTPCVLELGGKSPCIVDESAKISLAAKRIVFGKLLNVGQTCVAPDYILCHRSIKDKLVGAIIKEIAAQYGDTPLSSNSYGRIVNEKHFERLISLIDKSKVVYGGSYDISTLKIEPTVMDNVTRGDAIMGEEIFGPILPVLTYDTLDEAIDFVNEGAKPLALYVFSERKKSIDKLTRVLRFGGGCVNDTIIHLATSNMGFGGVGESGMGSYHGRDGFLAFSHTKSIVDKSTLIDLKMRYRPYKSNFYKRLVRIFLK